MKEYGKKIGNIVIMCMLMITVLFSFVTTVQSLGQTPNEMYALIVPEGYTSWNTITTVGHVELGDQFNVTFNMTINEQINSVGLDNITFNKQGTNISGYVNGTGDVTQGNVLSAGSTTTWITTDWSTGPYGYVDPLAVWSKTQGSNNTQGVFCNTSWNTYKVGVVTINFTDECGCSYGATDKPVNFYNGTVSIHPAHPTSPSATGGGGQISLSWTSGAGASDTVILGKQGSLPTGLNDGSATVVYNGTGGSTIHSGLDDSEHWYYRFYSWNETESMFSLLNTTVDDITDVGNQPCIHLSDESPVNSSSGIDLPASFSVTLRDPDGDTFDWSIETVPDIGSNTGSSAANGSKSCSLSSVQYDTSYTVYVNATDSGNGTAQHWYFTFETRNEYEPGVPTSFIVSDDGRFKIDLSWVKGSNANYTYVEYRLLSGSWVRGAETMLYNGTGTSTSHAGLNPGMTVYYQAWSYNTTDNSWSTSYASGNDQTDMNIAPSYGTPSPTNGSSGQNLSFSWSIAINDADGDTFNWTITCSNNQSNSANNTSNSTKSLSLSGLSYETNYTIYVNATDGFNWTRKWFMFTTMDEPVNHPPNLSSPAPANRSTDIAVSTSNWNITISDPEGDTFNWTIETNPDVGNNSGNIVSNGSKSCTLSGLSYETNYTIYVNATDNGSRTWTNETFWFITEDAPNNPPDQPSDPSPDNNAPNVPINVGYFSCLVTDPDGDSLDCYAYWMNHTLIDSNLSVASNSVVRFDVPTLGLNTTYQWYVNVSDGAETTQSPIWSFNTSDNQPPFANFTVEYHNATRRVWVNDTSTDDDGTVVFWTWDFGDNSADVNSRNAVHTYSTGGSYTIMFTVIDNNGGTDRISQIILLNYDPTSSFLYVIHDLNVTVNQTCSDIDGSIVNYTWDWGDGNYSYTANATYQYGIRGTYLVNLTVTDDQGAAASSWNALTVPPTPSSGFTQGEVNWLLYVAIIAVILCGVFFVMMIWRR